MEACQAYKRKDRISGILMLSSMRNDLMLRFEKHCLTLSSLGHCQVWDTIKGPRPRSYDC